MRMDWMERDKQGTKNFVLNKRQSLACYYAYQTKIQKKIVSGSAVAAAYHILYNPWKSFPFKCLWVFEEHNNNHNHVCFGFVFSPEFVIYQISFKYYFHFSLTEHWVLGVLTSKNKLDFIKPIRIASLEITLYVVCHCFVSGFCFESLCT